MASENRDKGLSLWFYRHHKLVNGWKFDYEHPGFFAYYKGNKTLYFTPDYNKKGEIDIDLNQGSKYQSLANIVYPSPLKAQFLFKAVSLYLV